MDITKLKGKIEDGMFEELSKYVETLTEQRDAAKRESIDGRKAKDRDLKALKDWQEKALEKLGLETPEDIETLDVKGQAEAAKQFETRMKKLERDLEAVTKDRDGLAADKKESSRKAALSEALGAHDFVDRDVVEAFISARTEWDGDELIYRGDGGKVLSIKDGVAELAKAKPGLMKVPGEPGAGVPNRQPDGAKSMTRKQFDALGPTEKQKFSTGGGIVTD